MLSSQSFKCGWFIRLHLSQKRCHRAFSTVTQQMTRLQCSNRHSRKILWTIRHPLLKHWESTKLGQPIQGTAESSTLRRLPVCTLFMKNKLRWDESELNYLWTLPCRDKSDHCFQFSRFLQPANSVVSIPQRFTSYESVPSDQLERRRSRLCPSKANVTKDKTSARSTRSPPLLSHSFQFRANAPSGNG